MFQKSYEGQNALYLIPTPIGNMDDITFRALKTLEMVDFILCEDTRVTGQLLHHFNLKKKLVSCHEYNESDVSSYVISSLQEGKNVGLVTDRGTPIISDPGYKVVRAVLSCNLTVIGLPGPTALIPALITSGIEPAPFLFYGFLNAKRSKCFKELEALKAFPYTLIFYESPHRLLELLNLMFDVFGDRCLSIHREISKMYEEVYRGNLLEVRSLNLTLKGEFVLVLEGNREVLDFSLLSLEEHVKLYLQDGKSEMEAIKMVAKERGMPKSMVYQEFQRGKDKL